MAQFPDQAWETYMADIWNLRASDPHQMQLFLSNYYDIESRVDPIGNEEGLRVLFKGAYVDGLHCSQIMASTPFRCTWRSRSALTVISGVAGQTKLSWHGTTVNLSANMSVCISPNIPVQMETPLSLSVCITQFEEAKVRSACSTWLGTAVDSTPRFSSVQFSPTLAAQWAGILNSITLLYASDEFSDCVLQALEDYALSLLISGHPHDFSKFFTREGAIDARAAAEAQIFIDSDILDDLTPLAVAEALGHPFPALARGFREHRGVTLRQAIFLARRARINQCLSKSHHRKDTGKSVEKLERLRLHILGSLSNPLRTDELAAIAGIGANRLRDLFRQAFELTPSQYILNERVNWAHHLLLHTSKSIAEIANETGFSSQAHLNVAFRKKLGVTPGMLRKSVIQS